MFDNFYKIGSITVVQSLTAVMIVKSLTCNHSICFMKFKICEARHHVPTRFCSHYNSSEFAFIYPEDVAVLSIESDPFVIMNLTIILASTSINIKVKKCSLPYSTSSNAA